MNAASETVWVFRGDPYYPFWDGRWRQGDFEQKYPSCKYTCTTTFMHTNIAEKHSRTFSAPKNGSIHEENIQYHASTRLEK